VTDGSATCLEAQALALGQFRPTDASHPPASVHHFFAFPFLAQARRPFGGLTAAR